MPPESFPKCRTIINKLFSYSTLTICRGLAISENNSIPAGLPESIRVSVGTAIVLGLLEGKLDAQPTTAYLMTYRTGKCTANCGFCPQARASKSSTELLSRVTWPTFPTPNVLTALTATAKAGKNQARLHPSPKLPRRFWAP